MSMIHCGRQGALSEEAKALIARLAAVNDLVPTVKRPPLPPSWQGLFSWRPPAPKPIEMDDPSGRMALQAALAELDRAIENLPGTDMPRLERSARDHLHFPGHHFLPVDQWQRYHDVVLEPIWARHPTFALLCTLHGDGYVREAALRSATTPLVSPLLAHILIARLLDWVPEVRKEALACLNRLAPVTDPAIMAEGLLGALADLPRRPAWREVSLDLFTCLAGRSIIPLAADRLGARRNGPNGVLLRRLMSSPEVDPRLPGLSTGAMQPIVRAVALRCLLSGMATHPVGLRKQWIDKSMGRFTVVRDMAERSLTIAPSPRSALIRQGALDKAACVRRIALEVAAREEQATLPTDLLHRMATSDPARSVRERADHLLRHPRHCDTP